MFNIFIYIIIVLSIWQTVEILHHSLFAWWWRFIFDKLLKSKYKVLSFFGAGGLCPFCFSNWIAFLYFGIAFFVFQNLDIAEAIIYTFVAGLAGARTANVLNDVLHIYCRTPNDSEYSNAWQAHLTIELANKELKYEEDKK